MKSQKALKILVEEEAEPNQLLTICHRIGNGGSLLKTKVKACVFYLRLERFVHMTIGNIASVVIMNYKQKSTLLLLVGGIQSFEQTIL